MTIETADTSRMHETHENIIAICDVIWGGSPRCDWCLERLKYWTDEMERLGEGRIGIYRYIEDAAIAFQWAADSSDWTFGLELEWPDAIDAYARQLLKTSPGISLNQNDRRDALRWTARHALKATYREANPSHFNHLCDLGFEVRSTHERADEVTRREIVCALKKRTTAIASMPLPELLEAIGFEGEGK